MVTQALLVGALAILALDVVLLLTLSPWLAALVVIQFLFALLIAAVGLVRLFLKKGPTVLQLVVWFCLLAGIPVGLLRDRVLCQRIEAIGTAQLLQDARALSSELHIPDEPREETLDGKNLLVPESMRALNPLTVTVHEDAVVLTISEEISSRETLVLMTDPTIVPGPVNSSKTVKSWRDGGSAYSEQWIAPGIRLDFWGS